MSRIIAGQLRLMDESSKRNAQQSGMGLGMFEGKMPLPQPPKEQKHPNLKKDASMRGKNTIKGVVKGLAKGAGNLIKKSTFVEAWSHFSVGGGLLKEDPKDHNKQLKMKRKGKRKITHPTRMGKRCDSGICQPSKKEHMPPTKKSDIKRHSIKKIAKGKRDKDETHNKRPKEKIQRKKKSIKLDGEVN